MNFTGSVPRRSRRRNPLAATCNPIFFLKDPRLGGEASRTIQNSATITKAGSTRGTNTLHKTGTAIPFLRSHGYERVSAIRTRAVDISSSPREKPRVPFVRAGDLRGVGDQDTPPVLPLPYTLPEGKKHGREAVRRDRREAKKGAPILLLSPPERREAVSADSDDASPFWCSLGHPGRGSDLPRVGKTRDQTTPTVGPTGQGPAKDDPEPNEPGCLPLQTSAGKSGKLLVGSTPPSRQAELRMGVAKLQGGGEPPHETRIFHRGGGPPLETGKPLFGALTQRLGKRTRR